MSELAREVSHFKEFIELYRQAYQKRQQVDQAWQEALTAAQTLERAIEIYRGDPKGYWRGLAYDVIYDNLSPGILPYGSCIKHLAARYGIRVYADFRKMRLSLHPFLPIVRAAIISRFRHALKGAPHSKEVVYQIAERLRGRRRFREL